MDKTIAAFTESGYHPPAYLNARHRDNGLVAITLRARGEGAPQAEMIMTREDFAAFIREAQGNL